MIGDYRGNTKEGLTVYGDNVTLYHPEKTVCIAQEGTDQDWRNTKFIPVIPETVVKYTGVKDKNDVKYFVGDIGEFDNGDRFVVGIEEWLSVFAEWIGDAECEDQTRDFYRISRAKIIGNKFNNPELIK